jgi:uncharacterized protein (TIGR03437 family)
VAHIYTAYTYAPSSVQIAGLTYSYDLNEFQPQDPSRSVAYAPLLLQNDTYYAALPYDGAFYPNWRRLSRANLIASDFVNVGGLGLVNTIGPGPTNPDFSCNGAPIQFGYITANSTSQTDLMSDVTSQSGIDNWMVTGAPGAACMACNCCGKKPQYDPQNGVNLWSPFAGPVAVATMEHGPYGQPLSDHVLVIWNLANQGSAPLNVRWYPLSIPVATQYYSDPSWTYQNLGDVFGLTLDNAGNIYVAATNIYGTSKFGSGGGGQIYKIANGTGAPSAFGPPLLNGGEGLGNIYYDCGYNSFYVSNFNDGLIYQLDTNGKPISTWDHGVNLPSAVPSRTMIPIKDKDGTYTALGRRPWAVHVYQNRLYYSIWSDDWGHTTGVPNEIWSVALDANGKPMGPERLEITQPRYSSAVTGNTIFSDPVADLSFSPRGTMMVAERTMNGNNASWAHNSRALAYSYNGSAWVPSADTYTVGTISYSGQANSAGGVDFDFGPGGRAWVTGDYLHFASGDYIYGIQGFPAGGGDITNSILIDLDNDVIHYNKTYIGDVKIPCPDCSNPPVPPVISGSQTTCGSPHYSVTGQAGVTYTWAITGGTPSTFTGSALDVNWTGPGGSITVTASAGGCGTVSASISVSGCRVILTNLPFTSSSPPTVTFTGVVGTLPAPIGFALYVRDPSSTPAVAFTAVASVSSGPAGWLTVTPGTDIAPANLTVSAAMLPAGTYTGAITITSSDPAGPLVIPVSYTVSPSNTITSTPANLTFTSTASVAPAPQSIILASTPAVAFTAAASVSSGPVGWLKVSPNQGTTGSTVLMVSADLLPIGTYTGAITITSANTANTIMSTIPVTFVVAAPSAQAPVISLVANAEGESPAIAPNTWVEIKGTNLAPAGDSRVWQGSDFVNNRMPTQLDGVSATVNGKSAYVFYISPTQVNILTPPDAMQGQVPVQITNNGATSAAFSAPAQGVSPSFFVFNGGPYVAATHSNGSLLGPASLFPGSTTPAKPGETVVLYANGFGPTSIPVVSGSPTQSGTLSPLPVIKIGGITATVTFAGLVSPGQFQFNVVVPSTVSTGDNALTAAYNGFTTQGNLLIAIQP